MKVRMIEVILLTVIAEFVGSRQLVVHLLVINDVSGGYN